MFFLIVSFSYMCYEYPTCLLVSIQRLKKWNKWKKKEKSYMMYWGRATKHIVLFYLYTNIYMHPSLFFHIIGLYKSSVSYSLIACTSIYYELGLNNINYLFYRNWYLG